MGLSSKISIFRNAKESVPISSLSFQAYFEGIQDGRWQEKASRIRGASSVDEKKVFKKTVPAVSPSARFLKKRGDDCSHVHSGIICLDIDAQDQRERNLLQERGRFYADPLVWAGHTSISGVGLALYIKINGDQHQESFLQLEQYYREEYDIILDENCKDVSRLRFVSFDPELYLNPDAKVFVPLEVAGRSEEPLCVVRHPKTIASNQYQKMDSLPSDTRSQVERVLKKLEDCQIDITSGYQNWVRIGFALANEFGGLGREYFHLVSRFHHQYRFADCDIQYTSCLNSKRAGGCTIGTFFWYAKQHGVI